MKISTVYNRYFADDNGKTFIPIGSNLCFYSHKIGASESETLNSYEQWFKNLSANGGNFTRIWLGNRFFDVMPDKMGEFDASSTRHLRTIIKMAEKYDIRGNFKRI